MQQNLTKKLNLRYIQPGLAAFKPWCTVCSKNIRVWKAQTSFQHYHACIYISLCQAINVFFVK